ncbi:hypothetical protein [Kribbella sp. NPDC023855]|uniref:hypothetical protein n=1 Tax=Kribbella sp. NPDC023855 TaxID=3154698 RepID=UPI0033F90AD9
MSDTSRALLAIGLGLVLIVLSVAGRNSRLISPVVNALMKSRLYADITHATAVTQMKAVLTIFTIFGAAVVILGAVALMQS